MINLWLFDNAVLFTFFSLVGNLLSFESLNTSDQCTVFYTLPSRTRCDPLPYPCLLTENSCQLVSVDFSVLQKPLISQLFLSGSIWLKIYEAIWLWFKMNFSYFLTIFLTSQGSSEIPSLLIQRALIHT